MRVTVTSVLGNKPKEIKNVFEISSISDVEKLIRACVTDRTAVVKRQDGKEVSIVNNGTVYTEVYNQKQLLADWCTQLVDEFPVGGQFAKSSI